MRCLSSALPLHYADPGWWRVGWLLNVQLANSSDDDICLRRSNWDDDFVIYNRVKKQRESGGVHKRHPKCRCSITCLQSQQYSAIRSVHPCHQPYPVAYKCRVTRLQQLHARMTPCSPHQTQTLGIRYSLLDSTPFSLLTSDRYFGCTGSISSSTYRRKISANR